MTDPATADPATPATAAAADPNGPPPPPPLFGTRWPGPVGAAPRVVLAAVAAGGLGTAALLPSGRPGIGWFLAGLVAAAAVAAVAAGARRAGALGGPRAVAARAGWAGAALVLAAVPAVRDAEWLVALCLLAACCAAALAATGPTVRGVVAGVAAVPLAALRGLPWLGRTAGGAWPGAGRAARLGGSVAVALALLAVFAPLLAAADAAFARLLDDLVPTLDVGPAVQRAVLFTLGAAAVLGAAYLLLAPPRPGSAAPRTSRLRGVEWALPVGLLVVLFALFVGVQSAALFGGDAYVRRTTGLTYAEYARSGFWQLLAVSALTLLVVVGASRWAPDRTPAQRRTVRVLLATLTVLALVVVASALGRLSLYQQAYGFTVPRLVALTVALWFATGFVITLAGVLRTDPHGPTRAMAAAGVVALLALAGLDPERFVAAHNIERFAETGRIDLDHLAGLGADAAPALAALPEPQRSCALAPVLARLERGGGADDWRSANLARAAAADLTATAPRTCPPGEAVS